MAAYRPENCSTWILLDRIALRVKLGVHEGEKLTAREIFINLKLKVTLGDFNDRIEETVDYDRVSQVIRDHFQSRRIDLIETIGKETIELLSSIPKVAEIEVEVAKPLAMEECESVSVKMNYKA